MLLGLLGHLAAAMLCRLPRTLGSHCQAVWVCLQCVVSIHPLSTQGASRSGGHHMRLTYTVGAVCADVQVR